MSHKCHYNGHSVLSYECKLTDLKLRKNLLRKNLKELQVKKKTTTSPKKLQCKKCVKKMIFRNVEIGTEGTSHPLNPILRVTRQLGRYAVPSPHQTSLWICHSQADKFKMTL